MKIIIHIGTEKTGTSAIQEFLLQNKSALLGQGFFYLHMDGRNEYRDFSAYCMRPGKVDGYFRINGITDKESREKFDSNFLKQFNEKISSIPSTTHTVIVSSEHFCSRLNTTEEVSRVYAILQPFFSSMEIVCYLRNQLKKVPSQYSTAIKSGSILTFDEFFSKKVCAKHPSDDYHHMLSLWETVFGKDKLNVRLFEKNFFHGGSLFTDFCSILGEGIFNQLHFIPEQQNEALSHSGCKVMRRINSILPRLVRGGRVEEFRTFLIRQISRYIKGEPVMLTKEQHQLVCQQYVESNAKVCARYFPSRPSLFESNK